MEFNMSDKYDYRRAYPVIKLPESGRVPAGCTKDELSVLQFDERVPVLEKLSNEIWALQPGGSNPSFSTEVTPDRIDRAWRLWMQSHHSFFYTFSVLAYAYDRLLESVEKLDFTSAKQWAEDVAALWRSSGALMNYGCDFYPTQTIYCTYIRTQMPEAFSGFWLREWIEVRKASRAWEKGGCTNTRPEVLELQGIVRKGLQTYHDYHDRVMRAAVPDVNSLAQDHRLLNGCAHAITEHELAQFDSWFRVLRVAQTRWSFVELACQEFSRTITEITRSNFLPVPTINDLRLGFRAALRTFGSFLGPIPIVSKYYSQKVRGE
jgi:hypothetical protein